VLIIDSGLTDEQKNVIESYNVDVIRV